MKRIFEAWAETPQEFCDILRDRGVTPEAAERVHRILWQTADLVCPMAALLSEQYFVSEYAYAIDYVIRHGGDLPKPEFSHMFPKNYPDFNYTEGIAEELKKYGFL